MRVLTKEINNFENQLVELYGWVDNRRDHGKLIFIDLRDRTGYVQVIFTPENEGLHKKAETLRNEWVIRVKGKVQKRPENMVNPKILTGAFEILAKELEIITQANTPPFDLNTSGYEINEELRMKYRYLDLRRERLQNNLRKRAEIIKFIRDFLSEKDFVEIETPILSKSTPEGARDYLVPSRLQRGCFYALPQSPQQYKQLLMVAGFEKYFQIARCFRDEDTRGDRQPEFTQLDLELSFVRENEILNLVEELLINLVENLYPQKKIQKVPFPRLTYHQAMSLYQSDRPDLRKNKQNNDELAFAFIIDFPMFEWKEQEKRWDAVHHPFTLPKIKKGELFEIPSVFEFKESFKNNPQEIFAYQYDVVLNGYEVGGGSLRIYEPELLKAVFEVMGNSSEDIEEKFGHLFEAFEYGVPPHGGIAFGLDRLIAIFQNEPNIREVIAFPKTGDGRDLLMKAPSEVTQEQLKELGLLIEREED